MTHADLGRVDVTNGANDKTRRDTPIGNVAGQFLFGGEPDASVIVDGDSVFTYAELRRAVGALGAVLRDGPAPIGGRVGIVARNSFFWVVSYLATLASGRVAVPVPTTMLAEDARRQAEWVDVSALLVEQAQSRRFAALTDGIPTFDEAALEGSSAAIEIVDVDPGDDAVLQLTSGTTAAPKAVRVTHDNLRSNADAIVEYLGLRSDDRMLVVLPFSYCYGLSLLNTHLSVGGSVALCHTLAFPETVVGAIDAHACTGFAGVPSTYQVLLKASSFRNRPLPSLRHLQQAGGKLAPTLIDEVVAAQPHARVFVMYGQTEATSRLSYLPPDDIARRRGSIGKGIPGQPLRVLGEDDRDVAPGVVGEVVVAGRGVTAGYWNDPDATAEKYRGGMLRTGDLATVDEDGYVYIVDRMADFIKTWGFRVSSQEVEEAALAEPGVVSAAAVGVPDETAGESIVLFVVANDPAVTADGIVRALRGRLAKHMVPSEVRLISEMPLNPNGKLLKSKLRERAAT